MFSTSLKRSLATLGIMAGLLVAAAPANAQGGGADFTRFVVDGPFTVKSKPASATSNVFELNTFGGNDTLLRLTSTP
jgi:hypothetical protein